MVFVGVFLGERGSAVGRANKKSINMFFSKILREKEKLANGKVLGACGGFF